MIRMLAVIVLSTLCCAAGAVPAYRVETIAEGLDHPWSLAFLPNGDVLVTERAGRLRLIQDGVLREAPIAGVPAVFASGQGGLFDIVLAPDFASSGSVLLSFAHGTDAANGLRVVRARYRAEGLDAVATVFEARPLKRGGAHYGGRIALLGDGTFAVGVGDAFTLREHAQKLDTHLGKIVRIGLDGQVPADNPFVGRDGALPEIYSLGHRNPQGLVRDAASGALFAHEHGPRGGDEINRIEAGINYGWPVATFGVDYTGAQISPFSEYEGMRSPLLHWTPSIAPSGMALVRGTMFPAWRGSLLVSALAAKSVRRVPLVDGVPGPQETLFAELGERLRDVREAPDGAIWLLTDSARGRVLRVVAEATAQPAGQ
jgi:glucose/arabinose dehydrogenase